LARARVRRRAEIGAWLPVLMLIAAAGLLLLPHFGTQVQRLPLIILIRWITLPDDGLGDLGPGNGGFDTGRASD
jgi:hypothetical protein